MALFDLCRAADGITLFSTLLTLYPVYSQLLGASSTCVCDLGHGCFSACCCLHYQCSVVVPFVAQYLTSSSLYH